MFIPHCVRGFQFAVSLLTLHTYKIHEGGHQWVMNNWWSHSLQSLSWQTIFERVCSRSRGCFSFWPLSTWEFLRYIVHVRPILCRDGRWTYVAWSHIATSESDWGRSFTYSSGPASRRMQVDRSAGLLEACATCQNGRCWQCHPCHRRCQRGPNSGVEQYAILVMLQPKSSWILGERN